MPVISFANSKGGSGKSTSALLLACELAEAAEVILIDADPRRPLAAWARLAQGPARLTVVNSAGERSIQDEIEKAAGQVPFVAIDLEGTASQLASYAMAESDLVIVPSQEQYQDAQAALDTLAEVRRAGRAARRDIPAAVLLTRTKVAVKSRTAKHVASQLRDTEGIRVMATEIAERDAYAALFSSGGSVRQLDPADVNGLPRAIENAEDYAAEVIAMLREAQK